MQEASKNNGAIVNADSIQFFKHLQIGAAKPTPQDMQKVPHFLYDIVAPNEEFTAGDYRRSALKVIEEQIASRPLYIVGGSGFYLQALEKGMYDVGPVPKNIQEQVAQFKAQGALYSELQARDPHSAARIGERDPYRLERALGLVLSEGRTLKEIEEQFKCQNETLGQQYKLEKVGVKCDREVLRKRIARRTEQMLEMGFIEEVESLLKIGYADTKPLCSVGYKEVVAFLNGCMRRADLLPTIVTSTMQLAKKQMTWFKRDHEIQWINLS